MTQGNCNMTEYDRRNLEIMVTHIILWSHMESETLNMYDAKWKWKYKDVVAWCVQWILYNYAEFLQKNIMHIVQEGKARY